MPSVTRPKPTLPPPASSRLGEPAANGFRGNKQSLPSKPCVACGRDMTWRKRWARQWAEVKFCSDACRRAGRGGAR